MVDTKQLNETLEQERKIHDLRLTLREWSQHFGGITIIATLGALVVYVTGFGIARIENSVLKLFALLPPAIIAGLILANSAWLEDKFKPIFSSDVLKRITNANESTSNVVGFALAGAVGLTFIGGFGFVVLALVLSVAAFVALKVPDVQDWLAEEPDLTRPKSREDIGREEAQFRADRGESVVAGAEENDGTVVDVDFTPVDDSSLNGHDDSDDTLEIKDPELIEAESKLASARRKLAEAEKEDDAEPSRIAGFKGQVTRWENAVREHGGNPDAV